MSDKQLISMYAVSFARRYDRATDTYYWDGCYRDAEIHHVRGWSYEDCLHNTLDEIRRKRGEV